MVDAVLDGSEKYLTTNGYGTGDDDHGDSDHDDDDDSNDGGTEYFPDDFIEYMYKELNRSPVKRDQEVVGWVFWGREHPPPTIPENILDLEEKIRHVLHLILKDWDLRWFWDSYPILIQFWAPIITKEGRSFLTTQNQPFALGRGSVDYIAGLCEYRMICCKDYKFDLDGANLGLPGRVFKHQSPESTPNVKYYSIKQYPQRDHALRCGVEQSFAFPVFEASTQMCLGVFEVVISETFNNGRFYPPGSNYLSNNVYANFEVAGLKCSGAFGHMHMHMQLDEEENEAGIIASVEIAKVLEIIVVAHDLPLAQAWVPSKVGQACKALVDGGFLGVYCIYYSNYDCHCFATVNSLHHLKKGVGVVGRALLSANVIFCRDVTQLSLTEYPFAHYAREVGLSGCFAICLQSSCTESDVYVLELFMPVSNNTSENPHTLLRKILETMRSNFRTFRAASGKEWEQLHIEDIGYQNGEKLDSVQMPQTPISLPRSEPLESGGEIMQVDSSDQEVNAINIGSNVSGIEGNHNVVTCTKEKGTGTVKTPKRKGDKAGVVQMPQTIVSLPQLEPLQSGGEIMQVDSSNQQLINATNNGSNVVGTEHNNIVIKDTGTVKTSTREGNKSGVKIKIPIEDILQASEMSLKDAAKDLNVSKSTLKRVCRDYGIDRWPPRKIHKVGHSWLNESVPCVNSDHLPSTQASATIVHTGPHDTTMQDANIVTIKAKYAKDNAIKFQLSLSSRLVELQQEVAQRLNLEAGTYYVKYRDEDGDLILIACDKDLQDYICNSRLQGSTSIVVLLSQSCQLPIELESC